MNMEWHPLLECFYQRSSAIVHALRTCWQVPLLLSANQTAAGVDDGHGRLLLLVDMIDHAIVRSVNHSTS
ncbi:MAG: hypothetical protein H7839_15865 [Magnetococcus sp. YQC-5]